eukprot:jgi/Mesen1/4558/ME000232S03820
MSSYGSLKVTSLNGIKVYNVSGGKSVPEWLSEKRRRALRKNDDYVRRIELVQDMEFNTAATKIKATPDGEYLIASGDGLHSPRITDKWLILGDDYSKLAFLCMDRSICLHAKFGAYYKVRIPREQEVTAVRFEDTDSMQLAVGTSGGQVLLYDLRSSAALHVKDHMYGDPIVDIKWHTSVTSTARHIISADHKIVKIWEPTTGANLTSVEPGEGRINDVCTLAGSGLMLMALDSPHMQNFFIPALGPAPRWCSFLDSLTEELEEESKPAVYDDFKFVTREELERLNLTSLLGSNLVRAYMHGFFLHARLYHKARALSDPFAYDAYRQKRIAEKLDAERAARISIKRKLPKVNQALAARLLEGEDDAAAADGDADEDEEEAAAAEETRGDKKRRKKNAAAAGILKDERFAAMFKDEAFNVDEGSREYQLLHGTAPSRVRKQALLEEHFELADDDDDDEDEGGDAAGGADPQRAASGRHASASAGGADENDARRKRSRLDPSGPRLYAVKDDVHAAAFHSNASLAATHSLPLEERVAAAQADAGGGLRGRGVGGSRQFRMSSRPASEGFARGRGTGDADEGGGHKKRNEEEEMVAGEEDEIWAVGVAEEVVVGGEGGEAEEGGEEEGSR